MGHHPSPFAPAACAVAVVCAVAALLPACAAPYEAPRVLTEDAVVLPLPVVEQDKLYECGLVSLSSLCHYYRVDVPDDLRDALIKLALDRHGLSGEEVSNALHTLGMEVWIFEGALDRSPTGLLRQVDEGRPVLVMTGEEDDRHYVLFIGYDEVPGNVCVLDPLRGQVVWPMSTFDRIWSQARRFSLLAVPEKLAANGAPAAAIAESRP